jgi:hypothetical protein
MVHTYGEIPPNSGCLDRARAGDNTTEVPQRFAVLAWRSGSAWTFSFPHEFGLAFGTEIALEEIGKPILVRVGMATAENGGLNEGASSKYHCGRTDHDSV